MEIGYELLNHEKVQIIKADYTTVEERYHEVYSQWLETDSKACYCKLIHALEEYECMSAAEIVKEKALQDQ